MVISYKKLWKLLIDRDLKKKDLEAIRLYKKHGFVDSGFIDEAVPDALNLICRL